MLWDLVMLDCEKLLAYFDKKTSLKEFDKEIPKLVNNFPKSTKIVIILKQTKNNVVAILKETQIQHLINIGIGAKFMNSSKKKYIKLSIYFCKIS